MGPPLRMHPLKMQLLSSLLLLPWGQEEPQPKNSGEALLAQKGNIKNERGQKVSCSPFCVTVWVTGPFPTAAEFLTYRAKDFSSVVQGTLNRWLNSNDTERTALRHCVYWKNKWINEQIEIHFCCISSAGPFPWGYQNEWVFEHAFGSIH